MKTKTEPIFSLFENGKAIIDSKTKQEFMQEMNRYFKTRIPISECNFTETLSLAMFVGYDIVVYPAIVYDNSGVDFKKKPKFIRVLVAGVQYLRCAN